MSNHTPTHAELLEQIKTLHAFATPKHRIAAAVGLPVRVIERTIETGELVLPSIQRSLFAGQPQRDALSER